MRHPVSALGLPGSLGGSSADGVVTQAGTNRVPMTVTSCARPSTSSRSTPGGASGATRARSARPRGHTRSTRRSDSRSTSPSSMPAKNSTAVGRIGVRNTTRRRRAGAPSAGDGSVHQRGCSLGPCAATCASSPARRLGMAVRLRELHDGAVRLGRHQERFLPRRVGEVDVHRVEARRRAPARAPRRGRPP